MSSPFLLLSAAHTVLAGPGFAGVGDFVSPGALARPHAHLSGISQCTECHAVGRGVTPAKCLACHERVQGQIQTNTGFHRNRGEECVSCHPDHLGPDFELIRIDVETFPHGEETGFLLDGAHRWLECEECHEENYHSAEPECAQCHEEPHRKVDRARDLAPCEDCHQTTDWGVRRVASAVLDHTDRSQVDFHLEGLHVDVACLDCHVDAVFAPIAFERCTECHEDPHRAPFEEGCDGCHTPSGWEVPRFDHDLTGYPLTGLHSKAACEGCHSSDVTQPVAHTTCATCHRDPHRGQFDPRPCNTCHTVDVAAFEIAVFDHMATAFPLQGKHTDVACAECHGSGPSATYVPLPFSDCDSCHEDEHEGQFEPTNCQVCHVETGWHVEDFDHDRTQFPLVGSHNDAECTQCHPDERWSPTKHDFCDDCHTEHPHDEHVGSDTCAQCHTPTAFSDVVFSHFDETGYDLEPRHSTVACLECHQETSTFTGLDQGCTSCHWETRPAGHYDGECADCHASPRWTPASLGSQDHALTGFALRGAHALADCAECHGAPTVPFGAADPQCISCHATDDIHRNLLGQSCDRCHTDIGWFRTRFRHQQTGWPLKGAHRLAACVDCHAVSYAGTPARCRACHETEAPLDVPAHQGASFAQCDQCHRPFTWGFARPGGQP